MNNPLQQEAKQRDFVIVKVQVNDITKRFPVEHPLQRGSFDKLKASIANAFPVSLSNASDFQLAFVDNEGDTCVLSSDEELHEAVSCAAREDVQSLRVTVKEVTMREATPEAPAASQSPRVASPAVATTVPTATSLPVQIELKELLPTPQVSAIFVGAPLDEKADLEKPVAALAPHPPLDLPTCLQLLLNVLETPSIVNKLPGLVAQAFTLLPTVTDEASALRLIETLLAQVSALREHELVRVGLPRALPTLTARVTAFAQSPLAAFAPMMQARVMTEVHTVLGALPTLVASALVDLPEDPTAQCSFLKAHLQQHLLPLCPWLAPVLLSLNASGLGACGLAQAPDPLAQPTAAPAQQAVVSDEAASGNNAPDVAQVLCPANHLLAQFQTSHGKFFCDECKTKVPQGSSLFGCRKCDFDLCPICVALAVSSRVPTPAVTASLLADHKDPAANTNVAVAVKEKPQTPKPAPAAPALATHPGVFCNGCGASPLQGARFTCTVCPDYDLCEACEAKDVHPPAHPLVKTRAPPRTDVHHGVTCDGCERPNIEGARFKCLVCPNFDLCAACEAKDAHPAHHTLLKLRVAAAPGPRTTPPSAALRGGRRGGFWGGRRPGRWGPGRLVRGLLFGSSDPNLLRTGSRGPQVAQLQQQLTAAGLRIPVDGYFGRRTEWAVRRFQAARGLVVDGLVGPRTFASLAPAPLQPPAPASPIAVALVPSAPPQALDAQAPQEPHAMPQESQPLEAPETSFSAHAVALERMGFGDASLNQFLLGHFRGNPQEVVQWYVERAQQGL